ncbi:hypothetical protein PW035_25045 [Nonomuraea angiospora]|nr:hypothetical protein [Nonomuraea angiospora]MDX3104115.1 hypothetical protein [Nonomuraea angiospora]
MAVVLSQAADQEASGRIHPAVVESAAYVGGQHPGQFRAAAVGAEADEGGLPGHDQIAVGRDGDSAHGGVHGMPYGCPDLALDEYPLVHGAGDDVDPQEALP